VHPNSLIRTAPELLDRVVDLNEARRSRWSRTTIRLWCDGTVVGNREHDRREYDQAIRDFADGLNGCPVCQRGGTATSIGSLAPDVVDQLIDPEDTHRSAQSARMVRLWCDGTLVGNPAHERVEYAQQASRLLTRTHACPVCGTRGSGRSFASRRPDLCARFVDPDQTRVGTRSWTKVRLWCNGEAVGASPHEWTEYTQVARYFDDGYIGCPICKHRGPTPTLSALPQQMLDRLVFPGDVHTHIRSNKPVTVACDGRVQDGRPHTRVVYDQPARAFAAGTNGCPRCGSSRWPSETGAKPASASADMQAGIRRLFDEV
jgi:hypothetical protein